MLPSEVFIFELHNGREFPFPQVLLWMYAYAMPLRIAFLVEEATLGKTLTLNNIKRSGSSLASRCYLYVEEEKMVDYLLLQCSSMELSWNFFSFIDSLFILRSFCHG